VNGGKNLSGNVQVAVLKKVVYSLHFTTMNKMACTPPKPHWLSAEAYSNILEDEATPADVRAELLGKVVASADFATASAAFAAHVASIDIPAVPMPVAADASLGHLFYLMGFFKHVAEMVGSGDESLVAAEFDLLRDRAKPRRDRRKVLERLSKAMKGKPIRPGLTIWLYHVPGGARPDLDPRDVLAPVDSCLPWRLGLPRVSTNSEYVHFEIAGSTVHEKCRQPNCKDAGFENLNIWKHGGTTNPHSGRPAQCSAVTGLAESVATPPAYDAARQPLGYCVAS
jgi:hypothetical protein